MGDILFGLLDPNDPEFSQEILKVLQCFFNLDNVIKQNNMGEPVFVEFLDIDDMKRDKLENL